MYSLKERISAPQEVPAQPILAAKRRRQSHPFFNMGPIALGIVSVLLIGLMAVLYLSQVGQAVAANQRIQDMHLQQAQLQRQNQDLQNTVAGEQSPEYITEHAKQQGLVPADPSAVQVIVVSHFHAPSQHDGSGQTQP